jgi:hypothetical protein
MRAPSVSRNAHAFCRERSSCVTDIFPRCFSERYSTSAGVKYGWWYLEDECGVGDCPREWFIFKRDLGDSRNDFVTSRVTPVRPATKCSQNNPEYIQHHTEDLKKISCATQLFNLSTIQWPVPVPLYVISLNERLILYPRDGWMDLNVKCDRGY